MTEKPRSELRDEHSETMQIFERLQRIAFDHLQDGIDEDLSILAKRAFQESENFREGVRGLIGGMLERDWYDKAQEFVASCGMSDSEFSELTKKHKPNPRYIA